MHKVPTLPTPAEAAPLRVLYADNPVITLAVQLLAVFVGDQDGHVHDETGRALPRVEAAARLVGALGLIGELSPREIFAVLAYFVDQPAAGGAR